MWCEFCERGMAEHFVCIGNNEYEYWCEACTNEHAIWDDISKEYVAEGEQVIWRKGLDISDSGTIGEDYDDISPTYAEENLIYCKECDCYVSAEDFRTDKCKWCKGEQE